MAHILVVSGHPDLNHSIANATILDELATALPDAEIRRLDWLYPDGKFNIAAEQESLLQADVIVWQFPFSWYGLPGLMKQWLDEVFVHGFAHGSTAKLGGKSCSSPSPRERHRRSIPLTVSLVMPLRSISFPSRPRPGCAILRCWRRFIPAVLATPTGMPTKSLSKNACPGTRGQTDRAA